VSIVWQVVKPLRPHPLSVGQARNFCTRRLSSVLSGLEVGGCYDDVVTDAATIASELVTNALTAGSTTIELSLALRDGSVLLTVADDAAGEVVVATPAITDIKGRGLLVVAALSSDWGVTSADGIKNVWAELTLKVHDSGPNPAAGPDGLGAQSAHGEGR
jgi:hypothetical protein